MVNARTRPPTHRIGRPPRGPRPVAVARPTAKDLKNKQTLQEAAAFLREQGRDEMAGAVDHVLTPAGWSMLGRLHAAEGPSEEDRNLPLRMPKALRDQIWEAAEAAGNVLTADVEEGFAAFIAGEFTPPRPQRSRRGAGVQTVNLNVRPDDSLRTRAEQAGEDRAAELGWKPLASHVATAWLVHKYELDATKPASSRGQQRVPMVPRAVRERIRAAAAGEHRVEEVVEEGLQKYLAGDWALEVPVWSEADRADLVALKIYPDTELWERVKAKGGMSPSQVAIAYLLDEFGIEAGA